MHLPVDHTSTRDKCPSRVLTVALCETRLLSSALERTRRCPKLYSSRWVERRIEPMKSTREKLCCRLLIKVELEMPLVEPQNVERQRHRLTRGCRIRLIDIHGLSFPSLSDQRVHRARGMPLQFHPVEDEGQPYSL
jgi:hypothetical protein